MAESGERLDREKIKAIAEEVERRGIRAIRSDDAVALVFRDGGDSLFIRDGDHEEILQRFERLDEARSLLIGAARRYLLERGWTIESDTEAGLSIVGPNESCWTTLDIGPRLTQCADCEDRVESFREWIKETSVDRGPSEKLAERIIEQELAEPTAASSGPVAGRQRSQPHEAATPAFGMNVLCRVMDEFGEGEGEAAAGVLRARAEELGDEPGMKVWKIIEQAIDDDDLVSVDMDSPGVLVIEFEDSFDELRVVPRGKKIGARIKEVGVEGAAAEILERYRKFDEARTFVINAIQSIMADRGCGIDYEMDELWFGTDHRQYQLRHRRELTRSLGSQSPLEYTRNWLAMNGLEGEFDDDAIQDAADDESELQQRPLPENPPSESSVLPQLAAYDTDRLTELAEGVVRELREQTLCLKNVPKLAEFVGGWSDISWYHPVRDTWAEADGQRDGWWVKLAKLLWDRTGDEDAGVILIHNGEEEVRLAIGERYTSHEHYFYETHGSLICWLVRDLLPPKFFHEDGHPWGEVVWPAPMGPTPLEIAMAQRSDLLDMIRSEDDASDLCEELVAIDSSTAEQCLGVKAIQAAKAKSLGWVREQADLRSLYWTHDVLCCAAKYGWNEVGEAMEQNPSFPTIIDEADDEVKEYGQIAQGLSAIEPSSLAARFAALRLQRALDSGLTDASQMIEEYHDEVRVTMTKNYSFDDATCQRMMRNWLVNDTVRAAVAWRRCRDAGVV